MAKKEAPNMYVRLMKIFEVMWLVTAAVPLVMAITRALNGQQYGNYIYITLFTGSVAYFMFRFKKRNRLYLEEHYRKQEEMAKKQAEASKSGETEAPKA